jgi:DNA processing protein
MSTSTQVAGWLHLALAPGLGPAALTRLLASFDSVTEICNQSASTLMEGGLSAATANAIIDPDVRRLAMAERWLTHDAHHLICWNHVDYPPLLKDAAQSPFALFVVGNPVLLSLPQIAIVGSRSATANGVETASLFARHLSNSGFTVTSGLALGIDSAAHRACVEQSKPTVAVCGTGLDRVYPAKNATLAAAIEQCGALVSEFPPGVEAHKDHFPRRNRIISGLSLGTLVVEAGIHSGALITAGYAAEQGREVFAIPGSIHSPQSKGCHRLIKQGAKLVEAAADIIEELAPQAIARLRETQSGGEELRREPNKPADSAITAGYEKLLAAMGWDPVSVDGLVKRCGLTAGEVSSMLLILELEGQIESLSGGRYQRKGTKQQ